MWKSLLYGSLVIAAGNLCVTYDSTRDAEVACGNDKVTCKAHRDSLDELGTFIEGFDEKNFAEDPKT